MKPYRKPIMAVDSDRIIVIDDNVKPMSFGMFMLKGLSFLALMFLTAIGICWGVSLDAVQAKLVSLDQWSNEPDNAALLFYTGVGFLMVCLTTYVLWVFLLRKKP
jgi:hypothetical protein